jgi:hypothetical protein
MRDTERVELDGQSCPYLLGHNDSSRCRYRRSALVVGVAVVPLHELADKNLLGVLVHNQEGHSREPG